MIALVPNFYFEAFISFHHNLLPLIHSCDNYVIRRPSFGLLLKYTYVAYLIVISEKKTLVPKLTIYKNVSGKFKKYLFVDNSGILEFWQLSVTCGQLSAYTSLYRDQGYLLEIQNIILVDPIVFFDFLVQFFFCRLAILPYVWKILQKMNSICVW